MRTVCGNCRTTQGPFERRVVPLNTRTQVVSVVCGFRRRSSPTKDERNARVRECNERRRALENKGALDAAV